MIARNKLQEVSSPAHFVSSCCAVGPRQTGKTTLALEIATTRRALYLYLEAQDDWARLASPAHYLAEHHDKLIILDDDVQRIPGLFQTLRRVIDKNKRAGRKTGQFLLLGFAPSNC